ncbi:MAG: cell wall protein [Kofleriaceae bacterium]|nr:cell wall protein [Kofleriaceae bacterium]
MRIAVVVGLVVLSAACGDNEDLSGDAAGSTTQMVSGVFDCRSPSQRLSCAPPENPGKRFVCHATGAGQYNKISVRIGNSAHVPGYSHAGGKPADQAPGASADDVGGGAGLDCECEERICEGTCTGAADGTTCDDGDKCTGDGTCNGDVCEPGPASCVDGTPVDACTVETGACDAETGACATAPVAVGTTCEDTKVCDSTAACVDIPQVILNDIESNGGVPGDWVELYNAGVAPADVSGWRFLDADDTHVPYVIPTGTVIPVGGYLVLEEAQFGFGLGAADSARLFDAAGALVDSYSWPTHAPTTYGRCPDGAGAFRTASSVTKGAANDCSVQVRVNEVESSGGVPGDWVELYNVGSFPVDLSGFIFRDADDTHAYVIPAGTTIASHGYVVLEEAQFGFGLGAADSARLFDGATLVDSYAWTAHAATTYGRCPDGTGSFGTTTTITKGAGNDCTTLVGINEVESNGGIPGDWVELHNAGPVAVDIGGWIFRDSDDTHAYAIPAGTTIASHGYVVLDEAAFGFGLGAADSARLFNGTTLVDSYAWTAHAAVTYGRCPDMTGAFAATTAATKGAANDCGGGGPTGVPWPGRNAVTTVDAMGALGGNLSGLFHDGTELWAARNNPGELVELAWNGTIWTQVSARTLRYPNGTGNVDAEDVTKAELASPAFYVAAERDNDVGSTSRLSILRYDTSVAGTTLVATHEWNLTADLPAVGANLGFEAITWIPDTFLVANSFFDAAAGHAYTPADYPNHGTGVFFVGVEQTGMIYAYALDHGSGAFTRLASIASGDPTTKALSFDRELGYLWAFCGAGCGNQSGILRLDTMASSPTFGTFTLRQRIAAPSTMPNLQNEGIAFAPVSQCTNGQRPFWWTDDGATGGHALRTDTIPCTAFAGP